VTAVNPPPSPAQANFAIVDIETTGLRVAEDAILQIAVVLQDWNSAPTHSWSTYVRPSRWLSRDLGPHHVHGISRRHLVFASTPAKAMQKFAELTAGRIVVAHNAEFDTSFLRTAAAQQNIDLHWQGVVCTLKLSRKLDPQRQQTHKLATLCERYGIDLIHAHDALHDATATAQLLPHLLRGNGVSDTEGIQPFLLP
jgi:DNA polymerase III alpha subunit (gram-positive type)